VSDPLIITVDDVRRAGHCVRGAKAWFETHGFDFRRFLREGVPAADLLSTGDGQAIKVVERTMARRAADGSRREMDR
jgi:hypothetical protein